MSNYSKTTNFTAKDALASGDPNKVVKGSEHDTEYDNIATASATKADKISAATNNSLVSMDSAGNIKDSTVTSDGAGNLTGTSFTGNVTGDLTGNVTGNVAGDLTGNVTGAATVDVDAITADTTNGDLAITRNGTGAVTLDAAPVFGLVMLDTPVSLASDTSTTATGNTAVDITASTTGVAVKAILNVYVSAAANSAIGDTEVLVGEGGETLTTLVHRAVFCSYTGVGVPLGTGDNQITVNLASGEIFDYQILQTGTAPVSRTVSIYLAGYYI